MLRFVKDLFSPKEPVYPPIEATASMALEPHYIPPFLQRLQNDPRFRLPEELRDLVAEGLLEVPSGQRRKWKVDGVFDGAPLKLELVLDMDDPEAPELTFSTSKAAAAAIDEEFGDFADGLDPM